MKLFPWGMVRAVAAKTFVRADRAVRSASVGPPSALYGLTDQEKQAIRDLDPDPVKESVKERMSIFTVLKIVTVLSAFYVGAAPWFQTYRHFDRADFMCPRVVVCAPTLLERILLTGSRFTAGIIHPGLVISVFSKCYATRSFLHHSWLGSIISLEPSHDIHTYFGSLTLVAGLVHSILHAARYIYANMAYIMVETDAGRSGLIACFLLLFIVPPMKFEFFKARMSFQFRKSLHMLFLPMVIALCFHSLVFRYVASIVVVWYTFDRIYFTTKQSFLIDHPVFEAVGRGTMVTFDLPTGYTFKAGSYIYVNSPMISSSEWHPFSIIQLPGSPPRATFYAEAVGDWTKDLFRLGLEQDRLPLWITAAQPSLMEKSIYYDNIVLVCTGAGITPAVSIIERFAKRKNLHLLWMTRDGGMVALFEKQLRKVRSTVHLTGTPDREIKDALQSLLDPSAPPPSVRAADSEETDLPEHGPVLKTRTSLELMLTSDSLSNRLPPAQTRLDDENSEEFGTAHGDARDVAIDIMPPRPDLTATRQLTTANVIRHSTDTGRSQHKRRFTKTKGRTEDPVKLVFGRPDIGAYLTETFAMQPDAPKAQAGRERTTVDLESSVSTGRHGRAEDLSELERSRRLNSNQNASKLTLMRPDATILEDDEETGTAQVNSDTGTGGKSLTTTVSPANSDRQLRWLVLYCGANPKVEEAIEKTCDELNVNWQKEYFGAW